ncbi:MAG: cell division protein FtsA [Deltaproteobacteria bacterium]|jgi:cell division protein FtsA|nr:cell division protein FtsA [Deltaproteobacteria bacterium]
MAKSEVIVGLDVGTTKICAVVGEPSPDGVDIVGIGTGPSTGMRQGVVVHIDNTVNSIKKALQNAESMSGCEIRSVYAGIAGGHIKGFNSHGVIAIKNDVVTPKDVERAMDAAKAVAIPLDREVIHTLPQEFIIDEQRGITDPLGMAGVRLEVKVHIVTGAVASAQNIIRCCHQSELDVSDIVLESLASSKAVLTDEERELGVVLVDLGGGTSDIAIFANNAIKHTAVLPLGGQDVTNDVAYGLRTPLGSAENIKVNYASAMVDLVHHDDFVEVPGVGGRAPLRISRRILAEICQPRMEEIFSLVDEELMRSGFKHLAGAGVVLTGGTALMDGCQDLAEQIFNLPARIGYPRNVGGLKDVVNSPKYATAVGLLRYGVENYATTEQRFRANSGGNMFTRLRDSFYEWVKDIR